MEVTKVGILCNISTVTNMEMCICTLKSLCINSNFGITALAPLFFVFGLPILNLLSFFCSSETGRKNNIIDYFLTKSQFISLVYKESMPNRVYTFLSSFSMFICLSICLPIQLCFAKNLKSLALKWQNKNCSRRHFNFFTFIFQRK